MEFSTTSLSRLDPARFSEPDRATVQRLQHLLHQENHPALVGKSGERIVLPPPVYELLVHVLNQIGKGEVVQIVPGHKELTTQAAANMLGISRPHVVKLLEAGEIPFRLVGSHRRVAFKDVLAYAQKRGAARKRALSGLTKAAQAAGVYDKIVEEDAS